MGDVRMPRLSDAIAEGTIRKWLKADGDDVARGDELAEIETDKATITFEADEDGPLAIVVPEGAAAAVGEVIARIGGPSAVEEAAVEEEPPAAVDEPAELPLEKQAGLASTAKGEVTVIALSRAQQALVRRVAEAKATVPETVLTSDVDMGACIRERDALRGTAAAGEPAPDLDDMVVKATALALREFPRANGAYRDGAFELYSRVNVGIVLPSSDALVVPTILDADRKPLAEIAQEARTLAARAADGSITPPELSGGTFTVSSPRTPGIRMFQPIINAPQAAILGVGATGADDLLTLTLVSDHRILHGSVAAAFLARIRDLLENPFELTD
jgi:pyruvate dehydrogenase E2 component (dihydrolipoamide acetyltransferase)